jgi:glycosyltransferase involved in cell wall biosynthesis
MSKIDPSILYVFLTDEFDEDENLAFDDIEQLDARGIFWKLLCIRGSKIHDVARKFAPERVLTIEKKPRENFDLEMKSILDEHIKIGINTIHVFGTNFLGSILPWVFWKRNVSIIVSEGPRVKKSIRHLLQSFFYSRIDAIIVPSLTLKKRIQIMRPKLLSKIRVVHPGLDFRIFNAENYDSKILREKWGISDQDYLVGMIAYNQYLKAQSAFIKAAASFLRNDELAKRTKFIIVGFEQAGSEELTDLIRLFHLQDQIILAPAEESLPKVLGTLDVYVIPSSKAMFGLQAIESMAVGTPIICATGPDAIEWIGSSNAGLLMRSGDSFDLQRKLRAILENPEELKRMRQRAVKFVRDNYDRATRTDKLLQVLERALRKRENMPIDP